MFGYWNYMSHIVNAVLWGTVGVYMVQRYALSVTPALLFGGLALIYSVGTDYAMMYYNKYKKYPSGPGDAPGK